MTGKKIAEMAAIDWEHDVLLTRREAAELLRVSESAMAKWAKGDIGPPVIWMSPYAVRYLRSDLEAFLTSNRSQR